MTYAVSIIAVDPHQKLVQSKQTHASETSKAQNSRDQISFLLQKTPKLSVFVLQFSPVKIPVR